MPWATYSERASTSDVDSPVPPRRCCTIVVANTRESTWVADQCSQPRPAVPPQRAIVRRSPSIVPQTDPSLPPFGWHDEHDASRLPDSVGYFTGLDDENSTLPRRVAGGSGSASTTGTCAIAWSAGRSGTPVVSRCRTENVTMFAPVPGAAGTSW